MRGFIIGVVATLALAITVGAGAATFNPNVLGHGGPKVTFTKSCTRLPVNLPDGRDWKIGARRFVLLGFNIYQNQIKCLIKRVDNIANTPGPPGPPGPPGKPGTSSKSDACWAKAGEVPPTTAGLAKLRNYIDTVQDCIAPQVEKPGTP